MKKPILFLLLTLALISSLLAGLPEIKALKGTEKVVVKVVYSEPKVSEYQYVFTASEVTISEDGKKLGSLHLSAEEVVRVDEYISSVKGGRKAGRNVLGATIFTIRHEESGKVSGTWTYRIVEPKESTKPILSFSELRERLSK